MECFSEAKNPHVVCIPLPYQGHMNPMLKFAKLLHFKGFHITFLNIAFIHQKILKSRGPDSLKGLPGFRFKAISDSLDVDSTPNMEALWYALAKNLVPQLRNLITKTNEASKFSGDPPVSCLLSDALLINTLEVAEEFRIPGVLLLIQSASFLSSNLHFDQVLEKVLVPLKGVKDKRNGPLHMPINFIPGIKDIRLKDLPSYFWQGNDDLTRGTLIDVKSVAKASAIIVNTFDALESEVLDAIKSLLPPIYTIAPLMLLEQQISNNQLKSISTSLWKESPKCVEWLDSKQPNSVVYVNFGSTTFMTPQQLIEFAWGLANSKHPFLWIIRPDIVVGEAAILPPEFTEETADRGMISSWCPQEQVLFHSSTGGFLTHSGWNSILETICSGVPVTCWPYFGDQQLVCWYACRHWGIGIEIDNNVKRVEVEGLVKKMMESDEGKRMKEKAMEWKKIAEEATKPGGSSYENFDRIAKDVLVTKKH